MAKLGTRKRVSKSRVAANAETLKPLKLSKPRPTTIAVIARTNLTAGFAHVHSSMRGDGGWYAVMGSDRDAVIDEALDKADEFNAQGGLSRYEVWVGVLTEKVAVPKREYRVVKL